ncbi:MAG: 50S ribosomal protein L4 [Candidatus Gottesmanbacteria bacterium GW2011_GWB1_49_7]|uniref:Large ribosomal subunit protein uL4 n=1 Tax=Candidatus Gottesmanbacteria bacterium GW2011_GWB1_49_7 TaxID=1618448 RepID=A0A0G1VYL5_9BACT|nr:MAG: LSU ribosomal protein L4P, large subunit ribosomal protein L4 [Microgenomates group bacterium GW2011_GWC1_49_7]KKW11435.1 MAG: 50S ribosomal protein L4 [Candidatus Gottesmanbacteria bacterium GW2011_GWB1_49_7]
MAEKTIKTIRAKVVDTNGKAAGSITLPETYFGVKPNKQLIALAVRVYLANQRVGNASTKTRGEVEGSTRKIYKQKGTGRARHGAIRAPIFVGGGIVFGPQPRDYSLKFPKKMKKQALASALSAQLAAGNVIIVSGMAELKPKTKVMAKTFAAVGSTKKTLLVIAKEALAVARAARNIAGVDILPVSDLHTYGIMTHGKIVFMKEAIKAL